MEIKAQDNLRELIKEVKLPRMARFRQNFPDNSISDVAGATVEKLRAADVADRIKPGMTVAITASSRGIANMNVILREIAAFIREQGASPVIFPAMGSHGSATGEGQLAVLREYGITEEFCGCPIHSSMETVLSGYTEDNLPVYIDKFASEADAIVCTGRIKAHTAFHAEYESGLMKMLCIGIGKQKGAESLHSEGFGTFKERIPAFARVILNNHNVAFGVGVMENAYDETCRIEVLKGEDIPVREPELLKYAKEQMAKILLPETDVLVVSQIGKDISGSGMDPNISGTWSTPYGSGGIKKQRVAVLDVTDASHGNVLGIGQADTTTMRLFHKIDFTALYPNILTNNVVLPCKIGMVMEDDEMAIRAAVKICTGIDKEKVRIIMIKDTLHLKEILVSESLYELALATEGLTLLEELREVRFSEAGELLEFK